MAQFKVNELEEVQRYVELRENLWLAADGQSVVAEGDPGAASLLGTRGKRLSVSDAARYGLLDTKASASKGRSKR